MFPISFATRKFESDEHFENVVLVGGILDVDDYAVCLYDRVELATAHATAVVPVFRARISEIQDTKFNFEVGQITFVGVFGRLYPEEVRSSE